jgi:hypothetical protein
MYICVDSPLSFFLFSLSIAALLSSLCRTTDGAAERHITKSQAKYKRRRNREREFAVRKDALMIFSPFILVCVAENQQKREGEPGFIGTEKKKRPV